MHVKENEATKTCPWPVVMARNHVLHSKLRKGQVLMFALESSGSAEPSVQAEDVLRLDISAQGPAIPGSVNCSGTALCMSCDKGCRNILAAKTLLAWMELMRGCWSRHRILYQIDDVFLRLLADVVYRSLLYPRHGHPILKQGF